MHRALTWALYLCLWQAELAGFQAKLSSVWQRLTGEAVRDTSSFVEKAEQEALEVGLGRLILGLDVLADGTAGRSMADKCTRLVQGEGGGLITHLTHTCPARPLLAPLTLPPLHHTAQVGACLAGVMARYGIKDHVELLQHSEALKDILQGRGEGRGSL